MSDEPDLQMFEAIPDPIADMALPPPPELPAQTIKEPTRAQIQKRRIIAAIGVVVLGTAAVMTSGIRADMGTVPIWFLALHTLPWLALAVVLVMSGMRAGTRSIWSKHATLLSIVSIAPSLFVAITFGCPVPEGSLVEHPLMANWTLICGMNTSMLALAILALLTYAYRGAVVSAPALRGAALGLACGFLADFSIKLHCHIEWKVHVALSHAVPILMTTLLGALLGRKVLRG